jgi:hypothetical protein
MRSMQAFGRCSILTGTTSRPTDDTYHGCLQLGALSILVLLLGVTRLLPQRWSFRGRSLRERSWPAVTVTLLLVFTSYLTSVSPYRVPIIVDGFPAEYTILHVVRHGTRFEEVRLKLYREQTVYRTSYVRHLMEFSFPTATTSANVERDLHIKAITTLKNLNGLQSTRIEKLKGWNSEGWYVIGRSEFVFTKDNGQVPPQELVGVFNQLASLPAREYGAGEVRDICFGFCYDPLAGLGIVYINERCSWVDNYRKCI